MRHCLPLLVVVLLAGCARFQPQPISPAETARALESRSLTNGELKTFLEGNLHRELINWPAGPWDFDMLTLAAFYYHPSLEVARAQWAAAQGGETTAGQRPNPVLNVTPGYNATTFTPSPWIPLGWLDVPIETAGKRRHRRARAAHLSEAARLGIVSTAWQVRGNLRSALIEVTAADEREALLRGLVAVQEQIVQRIERQAQVGALANSDGATARVALARGRVELADLQRQRVEARAHLSEALGVPSRALEGISVAFELTAEPVATREMTTAEARDLALQTRPDILSALADYAASESALQLEIARQYPDIHLQPGYQFDQGDSKWSIGLTVELPILHQNQGPIAEAEARRAQAAAHFNALQLKVLAEIDRAVNLLRATTTNSAALRALGEEQARRVTALAAQFQVGATDQLDLLNAQYESRVVDVARLDSQVRSQQALGSLEDAVQRPIFGSGAGAPATSSTALTTRPSAAK
jgi:outer membrane protein, heavy metal efflux system